MTSEAPTINLLQGIKKIRDDLKKEHPDWTDEKCKQEAWSILDDVVTNQSRNQLNEE